VTFPHPEVGLALFDSPSVPRISRCIASPTYLFPPLSPAPPPNRPVFPEERFIFLLFAPSLARSSGPFWRCPSPFDVTYSLIVNLIIVRFLPQNPLLNTRFLCPVSSKAVFFSLVSFSNFLTRKFFLNSFSPLLITRMNDQSEIPLPRLTLRPFLFERISLPSEPDFFRRFAPLLF